MTSHVSRSGGWGDQNSGDTRDDPLKKSVELTWKKHINVERSGQCNVVVTLIVIALKG